jgi:pseudouridine synthase
MELIPRGHDYLYPVGRLDYDSEGLLLLTNDGELAAALTHPRHEVERVYRVEVGGTPDARSIERLSRGIVLDGQRTAPAKITVLFGETERAADAVLLITLREGRNRQVRRMCEAVGHPVKRLTRIRIGPLTDRGLRVGQVRELTPAEVRALKNAAQRRT